jgi:hypothetical protein
MGRLSRLSAGAFVATVLVLSGCGGDGAGGGTGAFPVPTEDPDTTSEGAGGGDGGPDGGFVPSASPEPEVDAQLEAFVRTCEESLDARTWQPAQVSYPETMSLEVGQAETYNAAVDVRSTPAPPSEIIDAAEPTSEPVRVRCVLSARLVPVGDHITVSADDGTDEFEGWSYQTFTPSGTLEWAWTVRADKPEPGGLRLVLRPAAVAADVLSAQVTNQQTYETDVEVTGSVLSRASYWVETEFPYLKAIAIAAGTALVAVLAWYAGLRKKWRELRAGPAAVPERARPRKRKGRRSPARTRLGSRE